MKYEEMKYDIEKFFDYSLDMLCIAKLDGCILRINPSFQKAFGWKNEDLLAFGSYIFLHPDDVEPTYQVVEKLKRALLSYHFKIAIVVPMENTKTFLGRPFQICALN